MTATERASLWVPADLRLPAWVVAPDRKLCLRREEAMLLGIGVGMTAVGGAVAELLLR